MLGGSLQSLARSKKAQNPFSSPGGSEHTSISAMVLVVDV